MKQKFHILCLLACVFAVSCQEKMPDANGEGEYEELALTSSIEDLTLEETSHAATAFELSWTTGTNFGTGNKIEYSVSVTVNGTKDVKELGTEVYSWSRTVEQLNKYLLNDFGVAFNETVAVAVEVSAFVYGHEEMTQTAWLSFNVTTYEPVTETLYIIGDATRGGWSLDAAQEIPRIDNGIFSSTVNLSANKDFCFVVSRKDFVPSYNPASAEDYSKLYHRLTYNDANLAFRVTEDANYDITVNVLDMTFSCVKSSVPAERFEEMYFVGDCTNWLFEAMTKDPLAMNMWYFGRYIPSDKGGSFKFGTVNDGSWSNMFCATEADAPYTSTGVIFNSVDDMKWMIGDEQKDKAYTIYLDVTTGKERMMMTEFTAFDGMWMVGDATPNGWDLGNATELTATDDYTYSWTGALAEGDVKFTCDKKSDWFGKWFMSVRNGSIPTGESEVMVYVDKSDAFFTELYPELAVLDIDNKWRISEAGTYEITMNALKHTVSIKKK